MVPVLANVHNAIYVPMVGQYVADLTSALARPPLEKNSLCKEISKIVTNALEKQ